MTLSTIHRAVFGALLLLAFDARAADQAVEERLDAFKKIDNIKDIDWYSPLETASGGHAKPLPIVPDAARSITPDAIQKAIDYVDAKGPVALLIWQRGKLQLAHYGPGSGPTTRTDPASMHKSVLALLYGAALRDGYIKSIEEPAAKYLTEWAHDDRGKITIHDLLDMTSGLQDGPPSASHSGPGLAVMFGGDITAATLAYQAVGKPGAEFAYDSANSEALGIILQRATGMRYAQYLSKVLLKPLGTGDGRVWLDHPGGMAHTFCCLQLTAEDWLRIGLLIKDHGRADGRQIIPAAWIEEMIAPSAANPNFGLQIWRASPYAPERAYSRLIAMKIPAKEPFLAADTVFFDGAGAQRVYISRAADLVIVRTGDNAFDWDDSYLPNIIMRGLKTTPW